MKSDNARNTILFVVCTVAILILYQIFVLDPVTRQRETAQPAASERTEGQIGVSEAEAALDAPATVGRPDSAIYVDRREALSTGSRVQIETDSLQGSLSLTGARFDDLFLRRYNETLDSEQPVELFRPRGAEFSYFAQFGWLGQNVPGLPDDSTEWRLTEGDTLAVGRPITLTYDNEAGLRFTRRIEIDENYMFTVTDTVANLGTQPVTLAPFGTVRRQGLPEGLGNWFILHEGAIGVFGENGRFVSQQSKYGDWAKNRPERRRSDGGWIGITDKYWLAALIPNQQRNVEMEFRVTQVGGTEVYQTNMLGQARIINPGRQISETQHLFAGAKRAEILRGYESTLNVPNFDQAIDWGMFWFLTRPIFLIVEWFYGLVGNFGVAILLLTVVVKLILFPLANKAYESLSKMRNLAPKMEEIKKKHGSDPQKQQQELMALYQREKINPLAGCLPILVQIPVFYALYKVLFVTIEMRHAPFFGWIRDLSARDPTSVWNVFGLLPFDPALLPGFIGSMFNGPLHIGILPIFYGLTMWLQQAMNPPPPDPVQRQIFAFLPFVFTFIMAPFAAGLLIYWAWNNVLSILQQYVIMRRFKAENPIDTFLARFRKA